MTNLLSGISAKQPLATSTKTSIFYINDIHGQIPKMEQIASASLQHDIFTKQQNCDSLKLCSGDTFIGRDEKTNLAAAKFLDVAGINVSTIGNHEFDIGSSGLAKFLKGTKTKFVGANSIIPDKHPLKDVVVSSIVLEENGSKYGIIGIQPTDLYHRIRKKELLEGLTVKDNSETISEIQDTVNMLSKQGINKIILLSHGGNELEKEIAQNTNGIDIILGGHSHELIKGVEDGKNLLYSKDGEPVIITQAGKDGNNFGILNIEFNEAGQIVKVQNNVISTNDYSPSALMKCSNDMVLGQSPKIGTLTNVEQLQGNTLLAENPCADFVADAVRQELNTDIVLINAANFRGSLHSGAITERDMVSVFPFKNKLQKVNLSEPDLVEAIKQCAKSMTSKNSKPGLMQVSGLSYTIDKNGNLLNLSYRDKQNNERLIDINNPNPSQTYLAAYDDFLINGGDNMTSLKHPENIVESFDYDKDKVTVDYIKKLNGKPFEIKSDGRIKIV